MKTYRIDYTMIFLGRNIKNSQTIIVGNQKELFEKIEELEKYEDITNISYTLQK